MMPLTFYGMEENRMATNMTNNDRLIQAVCKLSDDINFGVTTLMVLTGIHAVLVFIALIICLVLMIEGK